MGGGELLGTQFSGFSFEGIHATAQGSQFSLEFFLQTTDGSQIVGVNPLTGQASDDVQTGVQTGGELKNGSERADREKVRSG